MVLLLNRDYTVLNFEDNNRCYKLGSHAYRLETNSTTQQPTLDARSVSQDSRHHATPRCHRRRLGSSPSSPALLPAFDPNKYSGEIRWFSVRIVYLTMTSVIVTTRLPLQASIASADGQFMAFICKGRGASGSSVTLSVLHHKSFTKTCHEHHIYVLM